jgi:2-oxoisovalerate dehydrogenase E1 component
MAEDTIERLERIFRTTIGEMQPPEGPCAPVLDEESGLRAEDALAIFDAQIRSRHVDYATRALRTRGKSYHTISSAGHEGNAIVGWLSTNDDPALLHYRSGGFFVARARKAGVSAERAILLGAVASREDPIAGGRHKVFGSIELAIPPQTSTIASHLPKAVGVAFAIERRVKLDLDLGRTPRDAIAIASFGDASANHSTAVGAIHAATHGAFQGLPLPILFVCEDNGIGISVPTPERWIESAFGTRPCLRYFAADGCDLVTGYRGVKAAIDYVRQKRRPAFLHLTTVRFLGHAGSDIESAYRSSAQMRRDEERDPIVRSAVALVERGVLSPSEVLERYDGVRAEVARVADEVCERPRLLDAEDVMWPIAPCRPDDVAIEAKRPASPARRKLVFGDEPMPEARGPSTFADLVNRALLDLFAKYPELIVFGEDVALKGGVYGVTRGLHKRLGAGRVFDTHLDEQSILGLAIGAGQAGLLPIPEIQYLAYIHNALDQLRSEASTQQYFSQGQVQNPMVVRVAGYAYQKGFGGHFHNDNSIAALRDIPGLLIASPSSPGDAARMLRTCVAAAKVDGRVAVFLEPIAQYHRRDLFAEGDGLFLEDYDAAGHVPLGSARTFGDGVDLTILTFANGVAMSRRVARVLDLDGIRARVVDLRWLAPLPIEDMLREANATGKVLVADETRRTGGVGESVIAELLDHGYRGAIARVSSYDSFVPLGPAADLVLLSEAQIEAAARALVHT